MVRKAAIDEAMDAEELRKALIGNRVSDETLAAALGVSLRAVYKYCEPTGTRLPFIRIGGQRLFDIEEVKQWLAQHGRLRRSPKPREPLPPARGRGRPKGSKNHPKLVNGDGHQPDSEPAAPAPAPAREMRKAGTQARRQL